MDCSKVEFGLWLGELQSIKERREKFMSKMGFLENSSVEGEAGETMELQRVNESSGAVLNSCINDDDLLFERRESKSESNCSDDYSDQDWLDDLSIYSDKEIEADKQLELQIEANAEESAGMSKEKNTLTRWWRHFAEKIKKTRVSNLSKDTKPALNGSNRVRMDQNGKQCMECTAVYSGQEIIAHNGLIWTMKFSPDGKYLASGGEDGVVCIWRVGSVFGSKKCQFRAEDESKSSYLNKKLNHPVVVIPERTLHIEEKPIHVFRGHKSDVLDLSWSKSDYHLLSSSMDKTARLWRVGSENCLGVFHHSNYVTSVQFNPVNEDYFISGSIDGKVRIWGIRLVRVIEWIDVHDIVTAVCFQPNGKGFVVGSISGTCRFYKTTDNDLILDAELNFSSRKKSASNKITGIQFLKNGSRRLMITSEDSTIRVLDGIEVVYKYRGSKSSGTQMSASLTPQGRHLTSVGEDSHVYVWNYDNISIRTSKRAKSIRSYEHFLSEGVSVAIPWSDSNTRSSNSCTTSLNSHDSERFSLANWFSIDGSSKGSITWPEEKLPLWDSPYDNHLHQQTQLKIENDGSSISSPTWGLVFVTADCKGMIRTYHNYGLPVKT